MPVIATTTPLRRGKPPSKNNNLLKLNKPYRSHSNNAYPTIIDAILRQMKPIPGYENYAADDAGNIWCLKSASRRWKNEMPRIIPAKVARNGHKMVGLTKNRRVHWHNVSRLVAMAFLGLPPSIGYLACHRNGIPDDDRPSNLYWGTHADNMKDKSLHGRAKGEKNPFSKLSNTQVVEIKQSLSQGATVKDLALRFRVSPCTISSIKVGRNWGHIKLIESEA